MRVIFTRDLQAIAQTHPTWKHSMALALTRKQIGLTASIDALAEGVFNYAAVRLENSCSALKQWLGGVSVTID